MSDVELAQLQQPTQQWLADESLRVDHISDAIKRKDTNQLKRLLTQLHDDPTALQQLDNQGLNPLHVAVITGNNEALEMLLSHNGLDLDVRSKDGHTALQYAQMNKNIGAVRLLVAAECNIDDIMNAPQLTGDSVGKADDHEKSLVQDSENELCLHFPITESYYWSEQVYQKAIESSYCDLTEYMYPELIVPPLVQEGHLSLSDVDNIMKRESRQVQTMVLLSTLERKGQNAYHAFLRALKNEKKHRMHEELAKKIIKLCKDHQSLLEHREIRSSFEQVTTVYVGDNPAMSLTPNSLSQHPSTNRSFLTESGFHSASLASSRSTHSATGVRTTSAHSSASTSRLTSRQSHGLSGRLSSQQNQLTSLLQSCRRQRRTDATTTGFCAVERVKDKPLEIGDVTVVCEKVRKPPRAPTPASGGKSACIIASNMSPRPYVPHDEIDDNGLLEASPEPVLFDIPSEDGEQTDQDDDIVEKDNTLSRTVLTRPFSGHTSPIDIPSRSNSNSSFSSCAPLSRQSSYSPRTSSPSIDLREEHKHLLPANLPSSPPKDISAIAPAKTPWRERLVSWFLKPTMYSDIERPSDVIGFKIN